MVLTARKIAPGARHIATCIQETALVNQGTRATIVHKVCASSENKSPPCCCYYSLFTFSVSKKVRPFN
jgi:hypothetical protein